MPRRPSTIALLLFALAQSASLAGPHEEGVASGRNANRTALEATTKATTAAPGESAAAERGLYGKPNLAAQASAHLAACAATPDTPACQALRGALTSANAPRDPISSQDPAIAATREITRAPAATLGTLAAYYSGCTTSTASTPAGTQLRSCLRRANPTPLACNRALTVGVTRTTSCNPGDWYAHTASGLVGLDVQCQPGRPTTAQRFRLTQAGTPVTHFDLDLTTTTPFPALVAVLGTTTSMVDGQPIRTGVWATDRSCVGDTCSLTTLVAPERAEWCHSEGDSGIVCSTAEPFLPVRAPCPAGTQHGGVIQDTHCADDTGCTTSALDVGKCYRPASQPTGLRGSDITGALPGYHWSVAAPRPVVGWTRNPEFGAIPTLRLAYTRATTTITQTDRWIDACPDLATGGRCTATSAPVCTEGPGTRTIDGMAVTRDCWAYATPIACATGAPPDACAALVAAGCTPKSTTCRQTNPVTGACEVEQLDHDCPSPAGTVTTVGNCPADVYCLEGNCFDTRSRPDADFARSMSLLEAAREAGVYLDTDRMEVFRGEANRCRDRLLKDCCQADRAGAGMSNQSVFGGGSRLVYDVLMNAQNQAFLTQGLSALLLSGGFSGTFTSYGVTLAVNGAALPAGSVALYAGDSLVVAFDPWTLAVAVVFQAVTSMMACDEGEVKLAMQEGAGLCHPIGTWCSSCIRVLGACVSCIEHTTSKCCFNSLLARLVNEQGRAQIGKGWGSARRPDCSGFTVAQLQALDFSAMDLSAFYASLVPTLPDVGSLQGRNAARLPTCYYGQGKCP